MSRPSPDRTLGNEVLTVQEVATYLRVSRVTIWRWCQHGIIPATRIGRSWRVRRDDILHLLDTSEPSNSSNSHNIPTLVKENKNQTLSTADLESTETADRADDKLDGDESRPKR